ncbi:hypothetical protein C0J52_18412 [Blattella germanica]|nr:hypothetical protein C0J52_18412 [Blattella germanica]
MNAERYLQMLEDYVESAWDNINDVIFMQDGAPYHFANVVRAWLDKFPGRWGRRGPHEWPARSPDLTPCDFLAKDEVSVPIAKQAPHEKWGEAPGQILFSDF